MQYPILIHTDGSALGNPGWAGAGVRVDYLNGQVVERMLPLGWGTNNLGELKAIELALDILAATIPAEYRPALQVTIHADSEYAMNAVTGKNKAKKNVELINAIKQKLAVYTPGQIKFEYVPAHQGHVHNERVDALAKMAAEESRRVGKK